MSEIPSEPTEAPPSPQYPPRKRSSAVWITFIIAVTIIALACIASMTVIMWIFIQNAPW